MTFIQLFKVKQSNLKPSLEKKSSLENVLVDKFTDVVSESDFENSLQYFGIDDFKKAFNSNNHNGTNFSYEHIFSFIYFDQLHTLQSEINISFDVIRITET